MANITLRRAPWRAPIFPLFDRDRDDLNPTLRRMFEPMLSTELFTEPVGLVPAVDISETPEEFLCVAELPGMTSKDVQVSFEDGALTIKGEKKVEREQKEGKKFYTFERSFGSFERSFTFPSGVDAEKVKAEFKDGVLTVHLTKTAETKTKARQIEISAK